MERIGIAASKMAKGSLLVYNFYVVLLASLFAIFLFFFAGAAIFLALVILGYLVKGMLPMDWNEEWWQVVRVCMFSLTLAVVVFQLLAIIKNIKIRP